MFMIGSLLCGTASVSWLYFKSPFVLFLMHGKDYVLLCVYRAVAGMGGGGIVSSVWLITAELVAEEQRAKWSQALSVTWSASAVDGELVIPLVSAPLPYLCISPLLGGVFSGKHVARIGKQKSHSRVIIVS